MFGFEYVDAPPAKPPRYGVVAAFPTISDNSKWQNGITFTPEACAPGAIGGVTCAADLPDMHTGGGTNPTTVEADPFVVWAADQCSLLASTTRDFEGRARRALAASESFVLAAELWEGDLTGVSGRRFADGTASTVTTAAVAPDVALGMLEWALGRCNRGRQGMIHVTPQVLVGMVKDGLLTNAGGLWLSPMGNIVVADAGYSGATPAGAAATTSQYAYATSMIFLRLGEVEFMGDELIDTVDFRVNTRRVIAWRPAVFEWDECCLLAAQVNVAVPAGLNL